MAVTLSEKGHLRLLYIYIHIYNVLFNIQGNSGLSSLNVSVGMALPSTVLFFNGISICWSEILHQLRLVVYPIIYKVLYIQKVVGWDF